MYFQVLPMVETQDKEGKPKPWLPLIEDKAFINRHVSMCLHIGNRSIHMTCNRLKTWSLVFTKPSSNFNGNDGGERDCRLITQILENQRPCWIL